MLMMIEILFIIALVTVGYCGNRLAFEMYKKTGSREYMVAHIVVLCVLLEVAIYRAVSIYVSAELI